MTNDQDNFNDLDPGDLVTSAVVSKRWKKSPRTLQRWRAEMYGPDFVVIGGSVFYVVRDVLAFEERQRRRTRRDE